MKPGPKVMCTECKTVIQSKYQHDFVTCDCPKDKSPIFIDGGSIYTRIGGDLNKMRVWKDDEWKEMK